MKFLNKLKSIFFPEVRYFKKTEVEFLEAAINRHRKRLLKIMENCSCSWSDKNCICQTYQPEEGPRLREKIERIEKQLEILRAREKQDETI